MSDYLSIRNVPLQLCKALKQRSKAKNKSLNKVVIELLYQGLGLSPEGDFDNRLGKLAGTWDKNEYLEFEKNFKSIRTIDKELWGD